MQADRFTIKSQEALQAEKAFTENALNTLGAVLGAALTGFVLLRLGGMRQTLLVAVGVNFAAALGALGMDWVWRTAAKRQAGHINRRSTCAAALLLPWSAWSSLS